MWTQNPDTKQWTSQHDSLSRQDYNLLKVELEKTRYYSKCLHGTTYLPINRLDDIYDILNYTDESNWIVGAATSPYAQAVPLTQFDVQIDSSNITQYDKYQLEYGHTLKNLFTPEKIINDSVDNYIFVDVATTDEITDITGEKISLSIDGVKLLDGHRILVKDQKTYVTLSNFIDPETYFTNNYYVSQIDVASTIYYFYNSENGIYKYTNNRLIRETDIDAYEDCVRYSIGCKMGVVNRDKQWHMSRLKNGYYPLYLNSENVEFTEKHNWLLRNRVDYNNVLDINYYDTARYSAETMNILGYTYSLPERIIAVGEFGVIVNKQGGVSNIINNKYKATLRSLGKTRNNYWVCGDEGTILKVSKLSFEIEKITIDTFNNLNSISFFNDLRGFVVGDFNTIYETIDGGVTWSKIEIEEFEGFKYNKVIYYNFNKAYIVGDTGVYLELELLNSEWTIYKRTIKKQLDIDDEFDLIDDINDIIHYKWSPSNGGLGSISNPWSLTYSGTVSAGTISNVKDAMLLVTNRNNIILHDLNGFTDIFDYVYFDTRQNVGDIKSVSANAQDIYFSTPDSIFQLNLNDFPTIGTISNVSVINGSASIVVYDNIPKINRLFNFNDQSLLIGGDNSLLKTATFSGTASVNVLDSVFLDSLKSKLLFLDYEVAGKMNFFDDEQNYRLPNPIIFSATTSSLIVVSTQSSEYNWLSYYKDSVKTWEYYGTPALTLLSDSNKIEFNTTFTKVTLPSDNYLSMTSSSVCIDINVVKDLAPSVAKYRISKFLDIGTSIVAPSQVFTIYAYNDLLILRHNSLFANVGDMLEIKCNTIKSSFMINKKINLGGDIYYYCYTSLNQTILMDLKKSNDTITVTNLNTWYNQDSLISNFNNHPVGIGYNMTSYSNEEINVACLFNNYTAYYNMASTIYVNSNPATMSYQESFLDFGFKPTYNLYAYLNNIDSNRFNTSKEFLAMPKYYSVPFSDLTYGTSSFNGIYFDTNVGSNKMYFSTSLYTEWKTIFNNTFIDVNCHYTSSTYSTEKLFITNKYFDENVGYVLEFHKKLNYNIGATISSFDILSRNNLEQISNDLMELNNIQRAKSFANYNVKLGQDDLSIPGLWSFSNLKNELNFKFNTDSYAKALLSDHDIKESVSAVVYMDTNNALALNTVKLTQQVVSNINYLAQDISGKLLINTTSEHKLQVNDGFVLNLKNVPNTSYYLNPQYNGFLTVDSIIDAFTIVANISFGTLALSDVGTIEHFKKDPFLNYQPVDIIDVGIDKKTKKSVAILAENIILNKSTYSLINLDLNKFKFTLVDGLNLDILIQKYSWILEAEIDEALLGEDKNGLVWYTGKWYCGRWFGGTWYSGIWYGGDWYDGTWDSVKVENRILSAKIDAVVKDRKYSQWRSGRWYNGSWVIGSWYNGSWYAGTWTDGLWFNGIWNDGVWNDGEFIGGTWVTGTWNDGVFSGQNKPAYWIDGKWYGGDFENGIWYNGAWAQQNNKKSRFGTKPSNSRPAIWHGGKWFSGEFHSILNLNDKGQPTVSERHSYSTWNTGIWMGGDFYGGVAFNIDMRNGKWHGGILEELPIHAITATTSFINGATVSNNSIELVGEWRFNPLDTIWIIDNYTNTNATLGTNQEPKSYQVSDIDIDYSIPSKKTIVHLYYGDNTIAIPGVATVPFNNIITTGFRVVSKFSKSKWYSGIWENGIFEEGEFYGGIWYNGVFNKSKWLN